MARARITVTFEYEINPQSYPKLYTIEQMLAYDIEMFKDDGFALAEVMESHEFEIKGEIK